MSSAPLKQALERKTVRRSRYGCRNCKLRKVKCDENKPHCKGCTSYGVLCNFGLNIPDLHPITANGAGPLIRGRTEPRPPVTSAIWTSDQHTTYLLNAKCQDFITRYLRQSLLTPDDPNMLCVNQRILRLAFAYPCLMHASLAVAFAYDRFLNSSSTCRRSLEECYHWSQSTALFNKRLRDPIRAKDKDPIWGTAAALAVLTFASPDANTPEDSWPLKSSGEDELDWLYMINGKMSLWHMVNPLRSDSLFNVMAATFAQMHSPLPASGICGIPKALTAVCRLEDSSTGENNPYFHAAHGVAQILTASNGQVTTGQSQLFMRSIQGDFKELLLKKDPVALVMLYLWYRKAGQSIWWIDLRARVECPAICLYLRLYHKDNMAVKALIQEDVISSHEEI